MRNNIAEIRNSLRMKQSDLAAVLNISMPYLSTLENKEEINAATLHKISKALNTTERRIFDYSNRDRANQNLNPHLEAFWTQGVQAHEHLDAVDRVAFVDKQLCSLYKSQRESTEAIRKIFFLGLFHCFCLNDYIKDNDTKESLTEVELAFAAGLVGADFFVAAALFDKREDIIQSFYNGLANIKEIRGGKDGYNNMKIIRNQYGMTQKEVSEMKHIATTVYDRIEKKNYCDDRSIKNVKKIARAFNCEFSDLFSAKPKDIYNIQARNAGVALRKKQNVKSLIEALSRDKESIELCVRDIIGFLNMINAKEIGESEIIQFAFA